MPRKKIAPPEDFAAKRKRLVAEILTLPVTQQEVLLDVLTILHERAIASLGPDPIAETRAAVYDLPRSEAIKVKDPRSAVPPGATIGAGLGVVPRKRRPRGFAAGVAGGAAVSNEAVSQVGDDLGDLD